MKKEIRYAFHVASGQVIHISAAERGLRCDCTCKDCGSQLEAVKGTERTHYFRHSNGKHCSGETAVHLFAKQVIAAADNINLPSQRIFYENVRVEQTLGTKRPDITVSVGGEDVHFEIKVTNAVKQDKRQFYWDCRQKCVEIDLSDRNLWLLPAEKLKELILEETWNKSALYWEGESIGPTPAISSSDSLFNLFGKLLFLFAAFFLLFRLVLPKKKH